MTPVWRKSSHSGTSGSQSDCVEIAKFPRNIAVRDSKDPDGPRLTFDAAAWRAFAHRVKSSEHDLV